MRPSKTGPITVEIVGGLGNQMFASAAGVLAARHLERPLRFDVSFFDRVGPDRNYELGAFPALDAVELCRDAFSGTPRYVHAALRRLHIPQPTLFREHGFNPAGPGYDPRWPPSGRVKRMKGYFQSWRYFEGHFDEVRELFVPRVASSLLDAIVGTVGERFVGVHVRLGDYMLTDVQRSFGLCSPQFYLRGIQMIQAHLGEQLPVVVFTDSPEHLPAELTQKVHFVAGVSSLRSAADDLSAMRASAGFVMSNSSYSWWAAFLGDSSARPVVAPRPWFRNAGFREEDLVLPGWLRTDARP